MSGSGGTPAGGTPPGGIPPGGPDGAVDPTLQGMADEVRQAMRSERRLDPAFRHRLRAELVAARAAEIDAWGGRVPAAPGESSDVAGDPAGEPGGVAGAAAGRRSERVVVPGSAPPVIPLERRPRRQRATGPGRAPAAGSPPNAPPAGPPRRRRGRLVAAAAAATAVAAAAAVLGYELPRTGHPAAVNVAAVSDVGGALSADPGAVLHLRFSQPLDHAATAAALRLTPSASVRTAWEGNTLAVSPLHGFAPNSPYVLTIDRTVARTSSGAPLADDLRVVFGTAPVAAAGTPAPPVPLQPEVVAAAADGAEAVLTADSSLLVTAAQPGPATGFNDGLVRIAAGAASRLGAAADAICVSRSGQSIAFLSRGGAGTQVIFADRTGTPAGHAAVTADPGTPLGWIGDERVSFVGGGRLRAVDRTGQVQTLSGQSIDTAHDRLDISPGGRYVYHATGSGGGQLIDLHTGAGHPLAGRSGDPAFSADGATVVWLDAAGGSPRVAIAASSGAGPVLTAPLPVPAGGRVSDLAVSPDGSRLVYSVTSPGGRARLRLASLPDGHTLAESTGGAGSSPNWAPSGRLFAVLGQTAAGPRIETVAVPGSGTPAGGQASLAGVASAFANAEVGGDRDAQHALAAPGVNLPTIPRVTRSTVLWLQAAADGTATARVRLTVDPTASHPVTSQLEQTLTLGSPGADRPPVVTALTAGRLLVAPAGPQLTGVDTGAHPGSVALTFDSDLDPASVAGAVGLTTPDGAQVDSSVRYDAAHRTVTVSPSIGGRSELVARVGTGLRDSNGVSMAAELRIPVNVGS